MKGFLLFWGVLVLVLSAGARNVSLSPDGAQDMSERVRSAVVDVSRSGGGKVFLQRGEYHFYSTNAVRLSFAVSNHDQPDVRPVFLPFVGVTNVMIDAAHAKFIMHGMGTAVLLKQTRGFALKGVTVEWAKPFFAEARITGFSEGGTEIVFPGGDDVSVVDGRLMLRGEDWEVGFRYGNVFDGKTHEMIERTSDVYISGRGRELGGGRFWIDRDLSRIGIGCKVGDVYVMRNGYRPHPIVCLDSARDTKFLDFVYRDGFGMGILAQRSENITIRGGGCFPRDDDECCSHTIDATHFSNCSGSVLVEHCRFEGMLDDALNVHSTSLRIVGRMSDREIRCRYMHPQSVGLDLFAPGDSVRFISGRTLENGAEVRVRSVKVHDVREVSLVLEDPIPSQFGIGDAVESAVWQCNVTFRNNRVARNRARGVLLTTPKRILCEDNLFEHVSGAAILLAGDAQGWYESGGCQDVQIRRNRFVDCLTSAFQYCNAVISIYPEVKDLEKQRIRYHQNVLVEDNEFETFDAPLLYACSADRLLWRNNRVERHARHLGWGKPTYDSKGCGRVEIQNDVPIGLTTEYRTNPDGIDSPVPRLSWKLPSFWRSQSAYEIEVDGKSCGVVSGAVQQNISWPGPRLASSEQHVWRVRVFDADGNVSGWSDRATFTTGIMGASDWKARWIGPNAATQPDYDFGRAQWITAPPGTNGVVELTAGFVVSDTNLCPMVEMVHLGIEKHEVWVNGKCFYKHSGNVHNPLIGRFRNLSPFLRNGTNEVRVFVRSGDWTVRDRKYKGTFSFISRITGPGAPSVFTGSDWSSPNGPVVAQGGLRNTAFGREAVVRCETATPSFARYFELTEPIDHSVLHVTGVGFYEVFLDGVRVGDKVLDPSPTDYDKRVLYSTYRLGRVDKGRHELRIDLGHGWYDVRASAKWNWDVAPWRDFPRAIAQLDYKADDGSIRTALTTDSNWRQVPSSVAYDDIREGEVIRSSASAVDGDVMSVREVRGPKGRLIAQPQPGARVVRRLAPVAIHPVGPGAYVFEFAENVSGWIRMRMRGQRAGDVVSVRYDERVGENFFPAQESAHDGLHDQMFSNGTNSSRRKGAEIRAIDQHFRYTASHRFATCAAAMQTDRYIASGTPAEVYEPRFTYNGFQYAYVSGLRCQPALSDVEACVIQTDFAAIGTFSCSDDMFNRLMDMADRSYRANFTDGVPTDCPHREKNGWTGDAWIASRLAQYCYENTAAYEKWLGDIVDAQRPDGVIPCIVPTSGWGDSGWVGPVWDVALPQIAWNLLRYRNDKSVVERVYPAVVKLIKSIRTRKNSGGLLDYGLGDWVPVVKEHMPSRAFTSTAYYRLMLLLTADLAESMMLKEDSERMRDEAEDLRQVINAKYYHGQGVYDNGLQTAQALALTQSLPDASERELVANQLVVAVEKADVHVDVGLIGMANVFRALSDIGRTDLAFQMLTNETTPSPCDWMRKGGVSLWEDWGDGASRNHIMFGDFVAWAYEYLAGIRLSHQANAFRHVVLNPQTIAKLNWLTASVDTPFGVLRSSWSRTASGISYEFRIPAGCQAEAHINGTVRQIGPGRYVFCANESSGALDTKFNGEKNK